MPSSPADLSDVVVRIRALMPAFAPAEQRVAQLAVERPGEVASLTISELARRAQTSGTTVIRMCRALGLDGYPALRLALAAAVGHGAGATWRSVSGDIGPEDNLEEIVKKIGHSDARAVDETIQSIDLGQLQGVVDVLLAARRVDVYGIGASGLVATDLQQKLHRLGRTVHAWTEAHIALTSAAMLTDEDAAVAISYSGTTIDICDPARVAKRNGARVIAITNHPRSPLAQIADLVLTTAAHETVFRSGAMTSRIAQFTIIDCLFAAVAQKDYAATLQALERTYAAVSGRRKPSPA